MPNKIRAGLKAGRAIAPAIMLLVFAAALVAAPLTHAQEGLQAPANIRVVNGPNPGEAIITWDAADGANFYRIGWLSRVDYLDAGDDWLERFAYSDVEGKTSYKVTRLTPGEYYWFIVASNATYSGAPTWPDEWTPLTLNEDGAACPPAETAPAPLPSSGDGTKRSSPIAYGQKFQAGNFDMQIVGIDGDAWPEILAENQFNDPPEAGHRYVMWNFKVENKRGSVDDYEFISDSSFDLVGSRGIQYPLPSLGSYCGVIPNDLVGRLYLGGSTEGNVCFSVPSDETGFVFLYDTYHSGPDGDRFGVEVWFAASPTG